MLKRTVSPQVETGEQMDDAFPTLSVPADQEGRSPLRVCIAACDVAVAGEGEDAGATLMGLAEGLAGAGHDVTVLFLPEGSAGVRRDGPAMPSRLRERVEWISLPESELPIHSSSVSAFPVTSYRAHLWLRERNFDLVVFQGRWGPAYYSLLAKSTGLALVDTIFVVCALQPSARAWQRDARRIDQIEDLEVGFLEQRSAELADVLVSPDQETLRWMAGQGWRLPRRCHVLPAETSDCARAVAGVAGSPAAPARTESSAPLVSVCITHFNRPALLRQAVASIERQDYPNIEVVLVDDGSTDAEAIALLAQFDGDFARRGWRVVRQENQHLGAARNRAVQHAKGDYLFFLDDDDCAKPNALSLLVKAALRTRADILTTAVDRFKGATAPTSQEVPVFRWVPLGPAATVGAFHNCFGTASALVRREAFETVGGFTEDRDVGVHDWEFFAKAVLKGLELTVVPEPLLWYRMTDQSMINTTSEYLNAMQALTPHLDAVPCRLRPLMRAASGMGKRVEKMRRTEASFNHIMGKPAVRAYRAVKRVLLRLLGQRAE